MSLGLVGGYLRAAVGATFAWIAASTQFFYLVLFSYSFFFEGPTGLTITIGAVVTLALLMTLTSKVNWTEKLSGVPAVRAT